MSIEFIKTVKALKSTAPGVPDLYIVKFTDGAKQAFDGDELPRIVAAFIDKKHHETKIADFGASYSNTYKIYN